MAPQHTGAAFRRQVTFSAWYEISVDKREAGRRGGLRGWVVSRRDRAAWDQVGQRPVRRCVVRECRECHFAAGATSGSGPGYCPLRAARFFKSGISSSRAGTQPLRFGICSSARLFAFMASVSLMMPL